MTPSKLPVRAVLIDPDAMARRPVAEWLRAQVGVTLIGEAADGRAAVDLIRIQRPQVAFLTPDLGGLDAFEVLGMFPATERPLAVLLATDADQAPRAFDFDAVDFLLPPYTPARLTSALGRVRRRLNHPTVAVRNAPPDRLPVRLAGRILLLPHSDIRFLRARNLKTEIRGACGIHLVSQPLHELEVKLPADRFLRVHRSAVVNLDHVRQVRPKAHGDGAVVLDDGTEIAFSRTRRRALLHGLLHRH